MLKIYEKKLFEIAFNFYNNFQCNSIFFFRKFLLLWTVLHLYTNKHPTLKNSDIQNMSYLFIYLVISFVLFIFLVQTSMNLLGSFFFLVCLVMFFLIWLFLLILAYLLQSYYFTYLKQKLSKWTEKFCRGNQNKYICWRKSKWTCFPSIYI